MVVQRDVRPSMVDLFDRILDKGIVIDAEVRVSFIGIDLLSINAHVVVASIDTYLTKYANVGRPVTPAFPPIADRMGAPEADLKSVAAPRTDAKPLAAPHVHPESVAARRANAETGVGAHIDAETGAAQIIRAALGAWNAHDPRGFGVLLDKDYVGETHAVPTLLRGRSAARRAMRMKLTLFPDLRFDVHDMIMRGDEALVSWVATGTRGKEPVKVSGCTVGGVKHGKIVNTWCYWDTDDMLAPLRVISGRRGHGPPGVHRFDSPS